MKDRVGAFFVLGVTALVAVAIALGAVRNLTSGDGTLIGVGVGMLLLVAVGVLLVLGEVRLGIASQRLAGVLEAEGALPYDPPGVERMPSGRLPKDVADEVFALRQVDVEADPQDWRAWYRLAVAYGDSRDSARGRKAMKRAIALERAAR